MSSVLLPVETLRRFSEDTFQKLGFTKEQARDISDVLILADLYGVKSHGTQRLMRYVKSLDQKMVTMEDPEIVFETPVSAVIDGHAGMGQLVALFATRLAIEKAKKGGMAMVTVRNSNHFGIAGYYSKMACDEGLIGIATTNSQSIMVHTNAKQAILGSNPIAFAMPAEPVPFWFDAATTVVPLGKLEVYYKAGKDLNPGWAVGEDGSVSTDAVHVLDCIHQHKSGGILPVGGNTEEGGSHKGYGYSMIAEILSAICSFGQTSNHHVRADGKGAGSCHSFIVIDPKIFGDPEKMKADLSAFLQELRDAKRADEAIPIYTHGEKEMLSAERVKKEGVPVDISTAAEMARIAKELGLCFEDYFGALDLSEAKQGLYDQK